MIILKTKEEIELIRESARLVGKTLAEVAKLIQPGVNTLTLDKRAEEFIRDNHAVPGFLGYSGFPNTLCISINSHVVHGLPSKYELKDGDIVSVDCGVLLNGFFGDSAYTFAVGNISEEHQRLLQVTKESLYKGIEQAKEGNRIGDIGFAVQSYCEANKYSIVRELVGHGIGRNLHESPEVPNYGRRGSGPKIQKGMVIAIEPMVNLGTRSIVFERDGWTTRTRDNKYSAHFEHTIAVGDNGPDILSTFEYIDEVLAEKQI
ncbi:MAG: type I methionyl aminopeptidase [Bacteroidales bacterium]